MSSSRVVEPFDVIIDISSCFVARPISASADSVVFHSREEALHNGIIVTLAGTAHAALDAVLNKQLLELLTRVLAALVAMMQQHGDRPATPDRRRARRSRGRSRPELLEKLAVPAGLVARESAMELVLERGGHHGCMEGR